MQAVVHLIGAAALTALAIYLVVSEPQLRRRYYPFRAIQFPVLVGAAVLVPLNVIEAFDDPVTSWRDYTVDVLTYAVLLCAVLGAVTLRIRTPPVPPSPSGSWPSVPIPTTWNSPAVGPSPAWPTPVTRSAPWS